MTDGQLRLELGPGLNEEALRAAVEESGFPFQAVIVDRLQRYAAGLGGHFEIQEEWTYTDCESGELRRLDALVDVELTEPPSAGRWTYIHVNFLLECKRSTMPYVFYLRPDEGRIPYLLGAPHQTVQMIISGIEDLQSAAIPAEKVLGIDDEAFGKDVAIALSFRKMLRDGRALKISNDHTYREIALPILKALKYVRELAEPTAVQCYHHLRLLFPLVVVRAPMVGVSIHDDDYALQNLSWVRVAHRQPGSAPGLMGQTEYFDVVEEDFLEGYFHAAMQAARSISENLDEERERVLLTGTAHASPSDLEDTSATHATIWDLVDIARPAITDEEFEEMQMEKLAKAHGGSSDPTEHPAPGHDAYMAP